MGILIHNQSGNYFQKAYDFFKNAKTPSLIIKIGNADVPLFALDFIKNTFNTDLFMELLDLSGDIVADLEGEDMAGYLKKKKATALISKVALALGFKFSKSVLALLNEISLFAVRALKK